MGAVDSDDMMISEKEKYRKIHSKEMALMDMEIERLEKAIRKLEGLKEAIEIELWQG